MNHLQASRIAGAATPSDPKAENSVERNLSLRESNMNECSCTILDERLDDLIAIADLTGSTLDDVVATVGRLPEATFAATIDVLAALAAPPAPTDLQDLLREHRTVADKIVWAGTDAAIEAIDRDLDEHERRIVGIPAQTPAEAYAKMMTIFPELCFDLQRPELAALRAEIGAAIGGEALT